MSSKRLLKRYDYMHHSFNRILLETAGNMDLDAEIKFTLGDVSFSIDVDKHQLEQLKDLYKALFAISRQQQSNAMKFADSQQALTTATTAVGKMASSDTPAQAFEAITHFAFDYMQNAKAQYHHGDFTAIFEKYINS